MNLQVYYQPLCRLVQQMRLRCQHCHTSTDYPKPNRKKRHFIDSLRIHVRGGAGGQGLPRVGGIGGKGGDIIIQAKNRTTLKKMAEKYPTKRSRAENGKHARKLCILGESGSDKILEVPIGVEILDDSDGTIGDLNEEGQSIRVAEGGEGGNPTNNFLGKKGVAHMIKLNLKLIADVGLVGFPNAGKSTFLTSISNAKTKIAEYPFTTIRPHIGTIQYPDFREITIADLPGLIEGAHENFGMGHKFLKHVERTKLLVFMVDIHGFQLSHLYSKRTPLETVYLLNKELELYKKELLEKPAVLALNKIDLDTNETEIQELLHQVHNLEESLHIVDEGLRPQNVMKFEDVFTISAKDNVNIDCMKDRLRGLLDYFSATCPVEENESRHHTELLLKESQNIKLV